MEKPKLCLDDVLDKFGILGRYHLKFLFLVALAYAANAMYSSNYIFAVDESGYRCRDEVLENSSCSANHTCSEWVYDNPHSFVAEFELACQDWKRRLVGTVHSFAYMVGLLIVGPMSDRIGRKKAIVVTGVLGAVFGVAKSFSTNYWLYILLEFLESAVGDICSPVYVLNLEIVSTKKRVLYYGLCSFGYISGGILFPIAAWGVPYWRTFLQVIYAPSFLFISYIFLLDESPRWLLTKGKSEKAVAVIQKIADQNRVKLDKDGLDKLLYEDEDNNISFGKLLKMTFQSRALLKRCLICIVWWTTSTFVNYGMMINAVSLQGNKYLNYLLVSVIEVPAVFINMYILTNFKRRNPLIVAFLASAVLCFIQPFLPKDLPWLSIGVYMISKMMSSVYFNITYMFTSELFPTYTRNSLHALCSSIGRIGSIIAPQTPALLVYWSGLPSVFFGSASLIAGLLTFLVPDTGDNSLPDTVREAELIGSCDSPTKEVQRPTNLIDRPTKDVDRSTKQVVRTTKEVDRPTKRGIDNLAMSMECLNVGALQEKCNKKI